MEQRDNWLEVMHRANRGERAAYGALARLITSCLHGQRAYDFNADWDDIIQDVALAVLAAVAEHRLRDSSRIPGYVKMATRNKVVDRIRRRGFEAPSSEANANSDRLPWEARELDEEGRLAVREACDQLPTEHRRAVVAVYAEGKTYGEASRDLAIPLGSLKRYLRDGMSQLRELLGDGLASGDPIPLARATETWKEGSPELASMIPGGRAE